MYAMFIRICGHIFEILINCFYFISLNDVCIERLKKILEIEVNDDDDEVNELMMENFECRNKIIICKSVRMRLWFQKKFGFLFKEYQIK